ncbi:MAG: FtsQ-type POTRA domain-containing protein [Alphaproteobacteria bacterium]|nr:FtsQ-type POTRA domain-containing protein [Alphaproteobacteria bacterium]MBV8547894.1 FtsQ-type POTRA domain-containing protein [Alphaproteobacteria bacterium]
MKRKKQPALRGSITQNTMRLSARTPTAGASVVTRVSAVGGSALLLLGLGWWLWHIGWPQHQVEKAVNAVLQTTKHMGFAVHDVVVEGRQQTGREALTSALETEAGAPILGFNPGEAEQRIAKLPWVESVVIERHLPDTLQVHLTERQPLARWQHEGQISVIDINGHELPDAKLDSFGQLPLLVGGGAPQEARDLITMLSLYPHITEKMTAAVRVGDRRWDLHLQPRVVAKLPEANQAAALKRLDEMVVAQKILERDVVTIDLRLPDRLIIEPGASAPTNTSGNSH